jgi:hypothetical protein
VYVLPPDKRPTPRRFRRPTLPLRLALGLTVVLGINALPTTAAWTDTATITGTTVTAATLAAPTNVAVSQACVADPLPVLRATNGVTSGTGNGTITLSLPAGALAGDVLVAAIAADGDYTSRTPTPPPSLEWNLELATRSSSSGTFVYTHLMKASEPAGYSWSNLSGQAAGGIAAYSGVDTAAPINVASGASGTLTAPSITTERNRVVLLGFFAGGKSNTPSVGSSGMTQVWSITWGTGNGVSAMFAQQNQPTAGDSGPRQASGFNPEKAQLLALQPPARPFATITWTPSASTWATGQLSRRTEDGVQQAPVPRAVALSSLVAGPLLPGSDYISAIAATYEQWVSVYSSVSYKARTCPNHT